MGGVGNIRDLNVLSVYEDLIEELIQLKNEFNFKYVIQKNCTEKLPLFLKLLNI